MSATRLYFPLLRQCAAERRLISGESLHAVLTKTGLFSTTTLSNAVIGLYAACGCLAAAGRTLDDAPFPDSVSFNSLIAAHSRVPGTSSHLSALRILRRMMGSATSAAERPNSYTLASFFIAVSNGLDGSGGREAHCFALKTPNYGDVFVGSSLVTMYSRIGLILDARKVFDEMPHRNSVLWTAMISGYAAEGLGKDAFELFVDIVRVEDHDTECRGSEFVFTGILSAICLPEFLDQGRQVHAYAVKNKLASSVSVGNSLVTFYTKSGCMNDAIRMFVTLGEKNSITWSAMITGYAQNGESNMALVLFEGMQGEGLSPTEFTFVGVLNACSDLMALVEGREAHCYLLKLGFESQLYAASALIDMYAKCGCVAEARKLFDDLLQVDVVVWTSIIGGYVQNGEHEEGLALYSQMEKKNVMPNKLTIASVLRSCSVLSALELGKRIQARAVKYGFGLSIPIGSALSTLYAKCGSLGDCNLVFRRMPQKDVVAWNSIISGFAQNGCGRDALDLFEEMRAEGVEPNHITFINVLNACSHMGLVDKGWSYFRSMEKDHCLDPGIEHYACMVDMLTRARMFKDAKEFVDSVPIDHGMYLWRIILGACRSSKDFEVGAYAGERLLELGSQEPSAYTMLSNIYAAWKKWDDVERVRRIMRLQGVNKEPGCSWIELKNRVHSFVVGEILHPEMKWIYEEIRQVTRHIRDEGYHPSSVVIDYSSEMEQETNDEEELQLSLSTAL